MKRAFYLTVFLSLSSFCFGQRKSGVFLQKILGGSKDSILQRVLHHPDEFRYQIIYTRIDRDKHNRPSFTNYYLQVDSLLYFNPASMVKMPLAFLALEKLNKIHRRKVNRNTPLQIDSNFVWQSAVLKDSTSQNGFPSVAQYIRKAFLVSDNDAYNRLYQFVGQETINRNLHRKGYQDVRIIRQFLNLDETENRYTNGFQFFGKNKKLIYKQAPAYNKDSFDFSHVVHLGKGYWNTKDSLINMPMDFTRQNNISLEDLQRIEQSVLFPGSVPRRQRFDLTSGDYRFLYQYMSQYPSETNYPKYDTAQYYDSKLKFFFRGDRMPDYLRVFNKVGWSYGFLTDVSYVADFKHKVEYMLSAVVYVNSDQILNDDRYDYDSAGYPFLKAVGQAIYQYELSRRRKYPPDLKRFKMNYDVRNRYDSRPLVKDVDD